MDFTVSWDIDGEVGAARKGNKFYPTSHPEFRAWLKDNGLTLQEWIDACPPPPTQPSPTWEDKRLSAYVEEADPLAFEALFDHFARQDDTKLNAWVAKINEIKTRYPKS